MTRIAIISDTHGSHLGLQIPDADILVHCGDFCARGTYIDAVRFAGWFGSQPHKHKIFIAGNHDLYMEQGNPSDIDIFLKGLPPDVHYLQDSGITLEGIKFWGSPVQPRFFNWAFNRDRGADIKKHWDLIPDDTDFLITHGPSKWRLDEAPRENYRSFEHTGCADLHNAILRIKPTVHAFGHIHNAYGKMFSEGVHYFNASCSDEQYRISNKPFLVEIEGSNVIPIECI